MTIIPVPRRRVLGLLAAAAIVIFPKIAPAQCSTPSEEGRWRNLDDKGEPSFIDVKMLGCGDEVLNDEQPSSIHYTLRVWVRLSTGKYFGRPTVDAKYRPWKGEQWLQGNVTTGGYQDQMWMHVLPRAGQSQMHVLIRHRSLDIKPSAASEYWFVRGK